MKTDSELQQDVLDELSWEPGIHATSINVSAKNGVVTLTGLVSNYPEKLITENVPKRVRGVRQIVSEIKVVLPSGLSKYKDADIRQVAETILKWNIAVPDDKVLLSVEKGHIRLSGEVNWQYQKIALENTLRYIKGVTGITNHIVIVPRAHTSQAKTSIENALKRNVWINAEKIDVNADGSKVTLRGEAISWEELQEAERSAWALPGISMVNNQLLLTDKTSDFSNTSAQP